MTDPTKVERLFVWRCPVHGPIYASSEPTIGARTCPTCGHELLEPEKAFPAERLAEVEQALGELVEAVEEIASGAPMWEKVGRTSYPLSPSGRAKRALEKVHRAREIVGGSDG